MYEFCYSVNTAINYFLFVVVFWWWCSFFGGKKKTKKNSNSLNQNDQSSQPVLTFGKHLKLQSILTLELAFLRRNSIWDSYILTVQHQP